MIGGKTYTKGENQIIKSSSTSLATVLAQKDRSSLVEHSQVEFVLLTRFSLTPLSWTQSLIFLFGESFVIRFLAIIRKKDKN